MKIEQLQQALKWVPQPVIQWMEAQWQHIPFVRKQVEAEYDSLLGGIEPSLKPYSEEFPAVRQLPAEGISRETGN